MRALQGWTTVGRTLLPATRKGAPNCSQEVLQPRMAAFVADHDHAPSCSLVFDLIPAASFRLLIASVVNGHVVTLSLLIHLQDNDAMSSRPAAAHDRRQCAFAGCILQEKWVPHLWETKCCRSVCRQPPCGWLKRQLSPFGQAPVLSQNLQLGLADGSACGFDCA